MNTPKRLLHTLKAAGSATVLLLIACGDEQFAGIQGSGAPNPVAVSATVVGPITGFGSIFVNGVEYATSGAEIQIDEEPGLESELRVGQIVTVRGTIHADGETGTAEDVVFSADVQGTVSQVDADERTFIVLGQTVRIAEDTHFDERLGSRDLEALSPGDIVQVSGFANAVGELLASRVDPESPSAPLQVKGVVEALNTGSRTFKINALTVEYGDVVPEGTLVEGITVKVRGTSASATGPLRATRVQVLAAGGTGGSGIGNPGERGEIEGFIMAFTSNADFVVNGQRVTTNANTQFVPGNLSLGLNVAVKISGTFNAQGVLIASRVEERRRSASLVRGPVDSVSGAANTLSVLGVEVDTSAATAFEDKSDQRLRSFRLSDLRAGDYVEVCGTAGQSHRVLASLVERGNPENRSFLQGVALDVSTPNLIVLGITVTTNDQTQYVGLESSTTTAAEFFSRAPNNIVKLQGALSGSVFVAERAQILN